MKTMVSMSIDVETYSKARDIIQNKLGMTISGFVNDYFKTLIKSYDGKE